MTAAAARVLAAVVVLLAWLTPAAAAPRLEPAASAGRVSVYAEPGLAGTARTLADGAEDTLDRIAADLVDLPAPGAIEVRLVRDAADLPDVAPAGRGAPRWAVGVAYPDLGVISIAMRRNGVPVDPLGTLRHELGHIALGAALGDRAPHWLHEGFAYQHSGEWSWERTETLAGMAWFGGIVALDELDGAFPAEESPANRAYAESYDFVGYLSRRGRWEDTADDGDRWPFRRFLTEIGRTGDLDAAAKTAFGRPLDQLFEEWRGDLTSRYMLVPIGLFGLAIWILCAILLALAWRRRRGQNRRRIAQWDADERAREVAIAQSYAMPPPYVAWPGEDPFADDEDREPPELLN